MSIFRRITNLFSRDKLQREIDRELAAHIEMRIEDNLATGMSPKEAHRDAHVRFGNSVVIKERTASADAALSLESVWLDLRYACRQLQKSPGFTSTAVLTLALGIGATAVMYSVIDAVILRPLPYNGVDRIVSVKTYSASNFWQFSSWPGYLDMRRLNATFEAVAGYAPYWGMTLKVGEQTQYLHVTQGTDNFFDVFGVKPMLGRTFLPGEDQSGKNNVVVLGYEVWRQTFNADRGIAGKIVNLDGSPYEVIGVMPAGFRFPFETPNLVYIPMHVRPNWVASWRDHWLLTVGRLKPDVAIQQAQADMAHGLQEIGELQPETDKGRTVQLIPISATLHGDTELPEIEVMLSAVFAVLLIACANVTGLLLARGITREREMALRVAIGAARARLIRQSLVENAILGILGAGAGLVLAAGLLAAMKVFLAHAFMRGANIQLNLGVVAVTLGAGMLSSIGAGLIPAWRAAKSDPNQALKSGIATGTARHQHQLRAGFVVTQIALSLVLVVFSGLLLLMLRRMLQIDFGFNPRNLLALAINIPAGDYKGRDYVRELISPLEARVRAIPGVTAAGFIDQPPILGYGSGTSQQLVGQPPDSPDRERNSESRAVTEGYYAAMGLPIVRGRNFAASDTPASQPVVVVNEAWVKEFLSQNQDPVAQAFQGHPNISIVGVARNVRQNLPDPPRPEIDFPLSQWSFQFQQNAGSMSMSLFVRTAVPPLSIVPQLRKALHGVAPTVAFQAPETMDDLLDDALVANRMESWLFGIFAGIAVLLAAVGINGLLMQEVSSRGRDIGVRMALGATRAGIAHIMLRRIALLLGVGLGAGVILTLLLRSAVARVVEIQYQRDGLVIVSLVVLLAVIGLLAAFVPIRRASSIDPIEALRAE